MKKILSRYGKRIVAFVAVFVVFFGTVCSTAFASDVSAYSITEDDISSGSLVFSLDVYCGSSGVWLGSDTLTNQLSYGDVSADVSFFNTQNYGQDRIWIWAVNKSKMFSKGSKLTIEISNYVNYIAISDTGEFNFVGDSIVDWDILLEDIYGNQYMYEIDSANISTNLAYSDISATINELPYDVYAISLMFSYDLSSAYGNGSKYIGGSNTITRYAGFHNSNFSFNEELYSKEAELLEGITKPSSDDEEKMDSFDETSKEQASNLGSLNSQNKVDKIDIGSSSSSIDGVIDGNAIYNYGVVLSVFTNHEKILQLILIVLSVGFVSYVLFGKKR